MIRHYSRHYYVSNNLDDLERVEEELESRGVTFTQIHVLSENDAEVDHHHHLHAIPSIMKRDVVHSTELGAVIGVVAAALVLLVAYFLNWTETAAGWVPFVFLSIVVLGFCTWEGGLFGIQVPNKKFLRFEGDLHKGKDIFFVDVESRQEDVLAEVLKHHPKLKPSGTGGATLSWWLQLQCNWRAFRKVFP